MPSTSDHLTNLLISVEGPQYYNMYLYNRSSAILFKQSIVRSIIYPQTMLNGNIKLL